MKVYGIGWIRSATGSAIVRRSLTSASPSSRDHDGDLLAVPLLRDHRQRRRGREADRRRERIRGVGRPVTVEAEQIARGVRRQEQRAGVDLGADRVQRQLERRHDPEVAAASAEPPEQLRILGRTRVHEPAVGGDDVGADEVVCGKSVLPHEPADPAAEREPCHAGGRDEPAGRREPELLRLVVDVTPDGAGADVGDACSRVDADVPHRAEVDHHSAVGRREAGDTVTAASYRDREVVGASEAERRDHVGRACGARDHGRLLAVVSAVPRAFCLGVPVVAGQQHLAAQSFAQLLHGRLAEHGREHLCHEFLLLVEHVHAVLARGA
jgi:hypothetical protein